LPASLVLLAPLAALPLLVGCQAADESADSSADQAEIVMSLPVSTESDDARAHFQAGLSAADMGRGNEANEHFELAAEADPEFAQAT